VVFVVECDEAGVLLPQVVQVREAVGAEEALVPHVVEVFDDPVAPGLSKRDEPGQHVEVQAGGDDRPELRPRRGDAASEVRVVVELGHLRHPEGGPHAGHPRRHQAGPWRRQDRTAGGMRAHVDEVEGVELDSAGEVTGSDHVDLMGGAGLGVKPVRVGHALSDIAARAAPGPAQPGPGQDPLDRA
jgi:hypothetical protein